MITHETARYVLYTHRETGELRVYLTDTPDLENLKEEMAAFGTPLSVHQPAFSGVDVAVQQRFFDQLSRMERDIDPKLSLWSLFEDAFMLGFKVGRAVTPPAKPARARSRAKRRR